jgi:hypothetical protein
VDRFNPHTATKRRVFLSFRAEDRPIIQGLRLLAANPEYDLEFYDESVRVAIDSYNAAYVKRVILGKIDRRSVTVSFISELTHTSRWVDWALAETDVRDHPIGSDPVSWTPLERRIWVSWSDGRRKRSSRSKVAGMLGIHLKSPELDEND